MAIDSEGNVACASSSGGKTGKLLGRVGDTPFVGQVFNISCIKYLCATFFL